MTTDDRDHNAEVVLLHPVPAPEPGGSTAPEVLPAVPGALDRRPGTDLAIYQDITRVPGERLPIIPPQWRGRQNIKATIALVGGQQWHRARYHGLRSPVYLLAALAWAIIGLLRVIGRQVRWWWVIEQHELRSQAAAAGDSREWMRLHKEAKQTRLENGADVQLGDEFAIADHSKQTL